MRFERWISALPLWWRTLVRRRQVEQDLDDEIRDHLESQVEELAGKGVGRERAWQIVREGFGRIDLAKEQCREVRKTNRLDDFVRDVRYAFRAIFRSPGFSAVAILTLALGIGANTAVFSLVDGILISQLPFADPSRLVGVRAGSYPNGAFAAMREELRSMDAAVYAEGHRFTLRGAGDPFTLTGARVSAELFTVLGVEPAIGRWMRAGEDVAPRDRLAILSHALWTTRFRGEPSVVGRSIEVDGIAREIIAVMPSGFTFPSTRTQIWIPLGLDSRDTPRYWAGDFMPAIGRLRPETTREAAHAELQLFQSRIRERFPWRMPEDWNRESAVVPLQEVMVGGIRARLLILIAGALFVLAIACANVANMSLSRAAAREREIAVRTAIGASPRRIARQLLTESIALASVGAVTGALAAQQTLALLKRILPADTPRLDEAHLNWRVLLATGVLAIVTGCAFGLAPVLHALRVRVRPSLDAGGRGGGRSIAGPLRAALAAAQIACAVLLVIAAALLVRSLWILSRADPGFRAEHLVTARISPVESACRAPDRCLAFYRTFTDQLRSDAGVFDAALVNTLPLTGAIAKRSLQLEGYSPQPPLGPPLFWLNVVSPGYFNVMGIRLEAGRGFTDADFAGPPVAIVTRASASRFWPGLDPIGRRVRFVGETFWRTVVGVAANVRGFDLQNDEPDFIDGTLYVPYNIAATLEDGRTPTDMTVVIRTTMEGRRVEALLRKAAHDAGAEVALGELTPMTAVVAGAVAAPAATATLLGTMALVALALGCLGVYGVVSFLVSRQLRELGIRLALGARPRDLFLLVMKEGALLTAAGVALGVVGAILLTRWLASELHSVSATDPATYAVVIAAMTVASLAACYIPTRRAMRVDPLIVLKDS